jgi:superfamily I DNA/RNA helicase
VVLTDEQANAVDLFKSARSLKISAFAGTGKTSTLTAVAKSTSAHGLYLAFNKSIAAEAAEKFPRTVDCRTTHSIAYRSVPSAYRGNTAKLTQALPGNRVSQILNLDDLVVGNVHLRARALGFLTAKTIQRFCQSGDDDVLVKHVPITGKLQELDEPYREEFRRYVSELAHHMWSRMLDPKSEVPLGHDGYLKMWSLSRPKLNYDFLLLDEAQDTNEAVLSVLRGQDAQLTLVGDRHQQIYEWRGAINAMASVETEAEALLTRSFRFGNDLAHAASSILKLLNEPNRLIGDPTKNTRISSDGRTETILCRTNSGVVGVVIQALSDRRMPHVVGGVAELVRMLEDVGRLKASLPAECPDFFGFENWDEVVDFSQSEEGESLRTFVSIVQKYGEGDLIKKLMSVARDEASADLIVSTGHKAKGREWDTVKLNTDFEPRVSKKEPGKTVINQEEARLLYVAVTRAKKLLVVPPKLAEKWGQKDTAGDTSVMVSEPAPSKEMQLSALPALPSFAKSVRVVRRNEQVSEPKQTPLASGVSAIGPSSTKTAHATSEPGLAKAIWSFLSGK